MQTKRILIFAFALAAFLWLAHTLWASEEPDAIRNQTDFQRQEATYQNTVAQTQRIIDNGREVTR